MRTILTNLLHLFFPNVCLLCERPLLDGEEQICLHCLCDLPHTHYHRQQENPVEQLFFGKNEIEHATAYLHFEKGGKVQHLIHALKYHDNQAIGRMFGKQIALELKKDESPLCDVDYLIPVPLHPRKKRQRGYNQSECIAQGIATVWHTPIDTQSLIRTNATDTQTKKSVFDRWRNVCSIFKKKDSDKLINKHILLIDDVITTGATLSACADALKDIPGIRISVLALAVA